MDGSGKRAKVLAVASKGGHWEELMVLGPAFEGQNVIFASTDPSLSDDVPGQSFALLADYNQNEPLKLAAGLFETRALLRRLRPDCVISTGAAPGLLCLIWGRLLGARTIWVDSIANGEELSLSGRLACRISHTVLTQWEHLAQPDGRPEYAGSVI